jgi:hypothetical protein
MIPLLVFYLHVVGIAAMFTRHWQEEGWTGGVLAALFMLVVFFVGWSISSFLMKLILEEQGFGWYLDRDAASLLLLTLGELVLYYFYFRESTPGRN